MSTLRSEENVRAATCDREIGSPVKGWHRCGAGAAYEVTKRSANHVLVFHACHRHLEALQKSGEVYRHAGTRPVSP